MGTGQGIGKGVRLRFLTQRGLSPRRRNLLAQTTEATFLPMEAVGEQGSLDTSAVRPIEEVRSGYTMFFDGDVVVAKITPCFENGKGAVISGTLNGIGFGTTELHVLTPGNHLHPRYLYYLTVSGPFRQGGEAQMTGAAGQKRVPEDFVRDFRVPVLALHEQGAIADYLDAEAARIDALIAGKENLLAILAEKRRAVITSAVTRGLDPSAPMRDSGIPWLGEIPAHWETERARRLFREWDERSETGDEELLTVSHLTGVTPRSEKDVNMFEAESTVGYKVCHAGDLVINTMWAWMGAMGVAPCTGIVSPAYNVYRLGPRLLPAYVDALVRIGIFAQEVTRYSKGVWSSRLRLYPEGFFEVVFPVPSIDDQTTIVAAIHREVDHIDELSSAVQRSLSLVRERREAVIAAAVTGQLKVRA